ncbi:hypothetical protein J3E68DRAFT_277218 [Trichoderma sp. SZMC 28012]
MNQPRRDSVKAPVVCLPCRKQKRKCDKALPRCSLCVRLCRECNYTEAAPPNSEHLTLLRSYQLTPFAPALIQENIKQHAFGLTGGESGCRACCIKYFESIHHWFPVLSKPKFMGRLPELCRAPSAGQSLLVLCMLLLNTPPTESGISGQAKSLYTLVKSSIALIQAGYEASLELLQSQALVKLFEVSHGIYPAAHDTNIANTIRALASTSYGRLHLWEKNHEGGLVTTEEVARIWQAVVILNRYLGLQNSSTIYRTTEIPSLTQLFATDDLKSGMVGATSAADLSASKTPLASLVEASRLLEQALTHVNNPTIRQDFNAAEAIQLIKTVIAYKHVLTESEVTSPSRLASQVDICNSALLSVFELGNHLKIPQDISCHFSSGLFRDALIDEVVSAAKQFEGSLASTNLSDLCPFSLHPVLKAAVILASSSSNSDEFHRRQSIESLKSVLHHSSKRWYIAKHYFMELQSVDSGIVTT